MAGGVLQLFWREQKGVPEGMMRFVRLIEVGVAVVFVGACAQVPLDHKEPYKTVRVQMAPEQVYAGMNKHPLCDKFMYAKGTFNKADRSFEVRYFTMGLMMEHPADFVLGEVAEDGGTKLVMRSEAKWGWQNPISNQTLSELQTGRCESD
ncbi:MAG: hypothetical protein ACK4TD_23290 [Ectopseudomonas guguanensis]